jgi:hypothetical protein
MAAFNLGPEGAKFDSPITMTIKYGTLPIGLDEKTVRIMYWDGLSWQDLASSLNMVDRVVIANISHLSKYAVVADPLPPARFTLSDITLTAGKVNPGENVTVQSQVTNEGGMAGTYKVTFTVNKADAFSQEIKLQPGQKELLSFQVQRSEPGDYNVAINDKSTRFVVAAPPVTVLAAPPATNAAPAPPPPEASTPASPAAAPPAPSSPESSSQSPVNWLLVTVFAVIGVAIAVSLAIMLGRRRPVGP